MRYLALAVVAAASTFVAPAFADSGLPPYLASNFGYPCGPNVCTACHLTNLGGPGNLRFLANGKDGFGGTLEHVYHLSPTDPSTWDDAFAANKAANSDIDGDGMPDLDEIAIGRDPNSSDPTVYLCGAGVSTGPEYGCGGSHVAKSRSTDGLATLVAGAAFLGLAAIARKRRNRR